MHTRKLLAVGLACVLGILCGVVTAVLFHHDPGANPADPGDQASPAADPLHIGIPLLNQSCTNKNLILLSWGDGATALGPAVSVEDARYLRTARSCDTDWRYHGATTTYVAYLGPFDTPKQACQIRMTPEYKGAFVTRLHDGNTEFVQCPCYLDFRAMPVLRPGVEITAESGLWTRALQQMLFDITYTRTLLNTGVNAGETLAAVRRLQTASALPATGVVDAETWHALLQHACRLYTA